MSPHKALYGYQPRHVALEHLPIDDYFPLDERLKALVEVHRKCKEFLETQQEKRNLDRNLKRRMPEFLRPHTTRKGMASMRGCILLYMLFSEA